VLDATYAIHVLDDPLHRALFEVARVPAAMCETAARVLVGIRGRLHDSIETHPIKNDLRRPVPPDSIHREAVDFVVESDRAQLSEIVQRVRDGRLRTNIGIVSTLDDAVAAFNPTARITGKTIIRVRP
jgi:hypothetical protein